MASAYAVWASPLSVASGLRYSATKAFSTLPSEFTGGVLVPAQNVGGLC